MDIAQRIDNIRQRMTDAAHAAQRSPETVKLVCVSKTVAAERIREAAAAGATRLGENYVQEARDKINALADLAIKENDHAANQFLQWFISEQVEEEAAALSIVGKLELVGGNNMGLLMMDQQLGQRTAAPAEGE